MGPVERLSSTKVRLIGSVEGLLWLIDRLLRAVVGHHWPVELLSWPEELLSWSVELLNRGSELLNGGLEHLGGGSKRLSDASERFNGGSERFNGGKERGRFKSTRASHRRIVL